MTETGQVNYITGVVIAVAEDGSRRILQMGDQVSAVELIETSESGAISIEFASGALDLGRNASTSFDNESENPLYERVTNDSAEEVAAIQQALLNEDETFDPTDPTTGLEAPGAGAETPVLFEDDGSSIVQTEYVEPRRTPDSGHETKGIEVDFPEFPPLELIQDPIQTAAGAAVAIPVAGPDIDQIPPVVSIYRIQELGPDLDATIRPGGREKLGFRSDPADGDTVTQITITGFTEDGINTSRPDWRIQSRAIENSDDPSADYQVDFVSYSLTPEGWQVILDVLNADPGEEIDFLLNIRAPRGISDSEIPLQVETTYTNSSGLFNPSADVAIGIEGVVVTADVS
jgi:hypothetical protein